MPSIGERIRQLRETRGMKSQELASTIGLSPSAMSLIEGGARSVKSRELSILADALGVSPLALLEKDSLLARLPVAARATRPGVMNGAAYRRVTALAELSDVLASAGIDAEPALDAVPEFDPNAWLASARSLAAWAAERVEPDDDDEGRFSALADAIESKLGVDVLVEGYDDDPLMGAAITDRSFPLIFVNAGSPSTRALFTLAHELGHVLAGHAGGLALDENFNSNTTEEKFANAFAAEFLMPGDEVRSMIDRFGRTANALAKMMSRFEVSFESLVYRLHNLRIINADGRDQLRSIGWGGLRQQIGDEDSLRLVQMYTSQPSFRAPALLTRRALLGYQNGVLSVRPLAALMRRSENELLAALAPSNTESFEAIDATTYDEPDGDVPDEELFADVSTLAG